MRSIDLNLVEEEIVEGRVMNVDERGGFVDE